MNFQAAWSDFKETTRGKEAIAIFDKVINVKLKKLELEGYYNFLSGALDKYYQPQLRKYNYSDEERIIEDLAYMPLDIISILNDN